MAVSTLNIFRPTQQVRAAVPTSAGSSVEKASSARVNPPAAKLCTVASTFNYLWLIRPFNLPCQCAREAISLLILFGEVCLARRARYKMLDILLRVVRQRKIISFHKHVTHSGFTLIGVKLIDEVGGQL